MLFLLVRGRETVASVRGADMSWLPGQVSGNGNYNNVPALILPDSSLRDSVLA